jgi:hypothetical protein
MTGQDVYGFHLYHVYFNGLKRENTTENFLVTYDGKKAPGLQYLIEHGHRGKLFMDSGAYPASKKNTDLDIDQYIAYVNEVGGYLDAIAQLDYIPRIQDGTPEQQSEKSMRLTWERYLYMWERIRPELRKKLIYIIHAEDTETLLRRALEWRDKDGNAIQYMGLGLSTTDMAFRWSQLDTATRLFKEYGYKGNVHGFGLQVLECIQSCPYLTSCDSSSAVRDQMTGKVFIKGNIVKVSDDTSLSHKSDLSEGQRELTEPMLRARAKEMHIDYDLAKVNAAERYLWGCRERSEYIESNYHQHVASMSSNLFRKK